MLWSLCLPILIFGVQGALGANSGEWPQPQLPSHDPFYDAPDNGWQEKPLGSILKVRDVIISSLLPDTPSKAKGYQLQYSTQDVHGDRATTVTTIIVPAEPILDRVISVQNAYDSADINCGPSYGLQFQAEGWGSTWNKLNLAFLLPYLQKGPVLNIPDYEGSNAAFTVGPQTAFHTLDSIRAALQSTEYTNISSAAKVIMFGYSGGAFATEWATEKRAWYAPELPIVGAVMGGPPPNVTSTYYNVNKGPLAELNIAAMLGVMNAYPEMDEWMRADLKDDDHQRERFLFPLNKCANACKELATPLAGEDVSSLFKNGDSFMYRYKDLLEEIGVMGKNISIANRPKYPLFIFHGSEDEVTSPIEDTVKLVNKWRLTLTIVQYHSLKGYDHSSALVPGLLLAWPWMNQRFQAAEAAVSLGKSIDDAVDLHGQSIGGLGLDDNEVNVQTQIFLGTEASHEL